MGWYYKSPITFPAHYLASIRLAVHDLNEPIIVGSFTKSDDAKIMAERFRYLKWCIRQDPTVRHDLFTLISNYDIRTYIKDDPFGCTLSLIAKPTKISDFVDNNPALAEEILSQV